MTYSEAAYQLDRLAALYLAVEAAPGRHRSPMLVADAWAWASPRRRRWARLQIRRVLRGERMPHAGPSVSQQISALLAACNYSAADRARLLWC